MGFVALTWVWAVALILAWPSEKNPQWSPELRLVAACANNETCGIAYGDIDTARKAGSILRLQPLEPAGEIMESDAWLSWKTAESKPWQYEVKRSSWNFETKIRYRLENDAPVLVELNSYDSKVLVYAIPLALFSIAGLFFRTLRPS